MTSRSPSHRPRWIDFHCHLDLYPNHTKLIEECDRLAIATLAVTTTPKAWPRNCELARQSQHVRVALGLHPQLVSERASELSEFEEYLPHTRYVGEVGLDAGPRYFKSLPQQKEVFRKILQLCAVHGDKILTIHAVRTVSNVLDLLETHLPQNRGRAVLHWFTGTRSEAKRAVELGCYFSINHEMLIRPARRELVANLPYDRLLTETDGPFVMVGDRQVIPADVETTVAELAAVSGVSPIEMASRLLENLRKLVS